MNRLLSVGVLGLPQVLLVVSCFLMFCCASFAASYEATTPFAGVEHHHLTTTSPRLIDVNVVEIDPTPPGIQFLVTPSNGAIAGETFSHMTRSFLNQRQMQFGINGSFLASASGGNLNIEGLSAARDNIYSSFVAMNISQDNLATIINSITGGGNAPGRSFSLQTPELAERMMRFGALNAISLDGGGSAPLQ